MSITLYERLWRVVSCYIACYCCVPDLHFLTQPIHHNSMSNLKIDWPHLYLVCMQVTALDERYKLSESRDYEVKVAFLQLAIPTGCKCYFNEVEKCLKQVGRMKYLRPLYSSLAKCSSEEKMLAQRIFSEAQEFYHPIARSVAEAILSKHS